jgi:hypothetical protein
MVKVPTSLTREQKELLTKYSVACGEDPAKA